MTPNICFMVCEKTRLEHIRSLVARSGITVWTSPSADTFDTSPLYKFTACLVIDMPGLAGLEQLEVLRSRGISTPTVLLADAGENFPAARLKAACVLDVLNSAARAAQAAGLD